MQTEEIRIATRSSQLAMAQAGYVANLLAAQGVKCELVPFTTIGDQQQDKSLTEFADKGIFTREIDRAVQANMADIAVHSLKDMPVEREDDLTLAAVPRRLSERDVLVMNSAVLGEGNVKEVCAANNFRLLYELLLHTNAVIASGSIRRIVQLKGFMPLVNTCGLRGNIHTRLQKMYLNGWAGIIMSEAALERLALQEMVAYIPLPFMPAPGQGGLGIQARTCDTRLLEVLEKINQQQEFYRAHAEREFLRVFSGGCQVPVGLRSACSDNHLELEGAVFSEEGAILRDNILARKVATIEEAQELGAEIAMTLFAQLDLSTGTN